MRLFAAFWVLFDLESVFRGYYLVQGVVSWGIVGVLCKAEVISWLHWLGYGGLLGAMWLIGYFGGERRLLRQPALFVWVDWSQGEE